MTTLLKQLEFLFGSRDSKTLLTIGKTTITLAIKNAQDHSLVQRIASKMGIPSDMDGSAVRLHLSAPLKESTTEIPQTQFQKTFHRLLDGEGDVMGLRELLGFFFHGRMYSGSEVNYRLSSIEKSYIKMSGWDLDFDGLNQVGGKINNGTHHHSKRVSNPLLDQFLDAINTLKGNVFRNNTYQVLCDYGANYYNTQSVDKGNLFLRQRCQYGHNFSHLVDMLMRNSFTFPNGERIQLMRTNERNNHNNKTIYDYEFKITPPSTFSRWMILIGSVHSSEAIPLLHERGILSEFLDVEECTCPPKKVEVSYYQLCKIKKTIRSAVGSYVHDGITPGFRHAVVGDSLQVWLTDDTSNTQDLEKSKLRKTVKAFDDAVSKSWLNLVDSYEGEYDITVRG